MKGSSKILAAILAVVAVLAFAGGALAYSSVSEDNGVRWTIKDILPAPTETPYTTDKGGLKELVTSDDLLSPDLKPGKVTELIVTEDAAPGEGKAYEQDGFFTFEDMFYIINNFTNIVSLDLSAATAGASGDDAPAIGEKLAKAGKTLPNLRYLALPKGLEIISDDALKGLTTNLKKVVLPESLTEIGKGAFEGVLSDDAVIEFTGPVPTTIGENALSNDVVSFKVVVPPDYKEAYEDAFEEADITVDTVDVTVFVVDDIVGFDAAEEGYSASDISPQDIIITNDGTLDITYEITFNGLQAASFDVLTDNRSGIVASDDQKTISIRPKAGWPSGVYEGSVTISWNEATTGDNDSKTVGVEFAVYKTDEEVISGPEKWSVEPDGAITAKATLIVPINLPEGARIEGVYVDTSYAAEFDSDSDWSDDGEYLEIYLEAVSGKTWKDIIINKIYVKTYDGTLYGVDATDDDGDGITLEDIADDRGGSSGCDAGLGVGALLLAGVAVVALRKRG
ncbi:MAG: leucine-rich repeat protein [Synergistaceae bacterium]|jgi:hypothetical protein|nr:leucine-rich repeat protein [Synergistaceae bacterium]